MLSLVTEENKTFKAIHCVLHVMFKAICATCYVVQMVGLQQPLKNKQQQTACLYSDRVVAFLYIRWEVSQTT